jgi:hypothetical protein
MEKVKIFYSYSHKDEELRDMFEVHMSGLKRAGYIEQWHDRKILPGSYWDRDINSNIEAADLILFLVSSDFLSSDYCYNVEVIKAINRHNLQECVVIPIILRHCDWEGAPFEHIQGLPKDMHPITSKYWHNIDEAFTYIAKELRKIIKNISNKEKQKTRNFSIDIRNTTTGEEFGVPDLDDLGNVTPLDIIIAMKNDEHISNELNYILVKKDGVSLNQHLSLKENGIEYGDLLLLTAKATGA